MFEHLAEHSIILVTGPQRAGTTICGKMIAADTGHKYIDEDDYGPHNKAGWLDLIADSNNVVIQCPAMCRYVHQIDGALVVMLCRNVADIIASQERIGWGTNESSELARYEKTEGPIAIVKYGFWQQHQRPVITDYLEVEYESLTEHPLWLDKSERVDFRPRQTKRLVRKDKGMGKYDGCYVKLGSEYTYWAVDNGERRQVKSVEEMYAIGLRLVILVSEEYLAKIPIAGTRKRRRRKRKTKKADENTVDLPRPLT